MISDDIRTQFEALELKTDEEIKFEYSKNQHGQLVVSNIERI